MIKKEGFSNDSSSSTSSNSSPLSSSSSSSINSASNSININQQNLLPQQEANQDNLNYKFITSNHNNNNNAKLSSFLPGSASNQPHFTNLTNQYQKNQNYSVGMQNLTNQLMIAAAAANSTNPLDVAAQVYLPVHLINQAAAQQHQQHQQQNQQQVAHSIQLNHKESKDKNHNHHQHDNHHNHHHSNRSMNTSSSSSHGSNASGGAGGGGEIHIGEETVRKREMRLLKNR
jgi:hypothetical protein